MCLRGYCGVDGHSHRRTQDRHVVPLGAPQRKEDRH
eukprot:gene25083-11537_t